MADGPGNNEVREIRHDIPRIPPPEERNKDIAPVLLGLAVKIPFVDIAAFAACATSLDELKKPSSATIQTVGKSVGRISFLKPEHILSEYYEDIGYIVSDIAEYGDDIHPAALHYPEITIDEELALRTALVRQFEDVVKLSHAMISQDGQYQQTIKKIGMLLGNTIEQESRSSSGMAERNAEEKMRLRYARPLHDLLTQFPNTKTEYLREVVRSEFNEAVQQKPVVRPLTTGDALSVLEKIVEEETDFLKMKYGFTIPNEDNYISMQEVFSLNRQINNEESTTDGQQMLEMLSISLHAELVQSLQETIRITRTHQEDALPLAANKSLLEKIKGDYDTPSRIEEFLFFNTSLYEQAASKQASVEDQLVYEPPLFAEYCRRQMVLYAIVNQFELPNTQAQISGRKLFERNPRIGGVSSYGMIDHERAVVDPNMVTSLAEMVKQTVEIPFIVDTSQLTDTTNLPTEVSTYAEGSTFTPYTPEKEASEPEIVMRSKQDLRLGNDVDAKNTIRIFTPEYARLTSIRLKSYGQELMLGEDYVIEYTQDSGHYRARLTSAGKETVGSLQRISYEIGFDPVNKHADAPKEDPGSFTVERMQQFSEIVTRLQENGYTKVSERLQSIIDRAREQNIPIRLSQIEDIVRDTSSYVFSLPENAPQRIYFDYLPLPTSEGRIAGQCIHFAEILTSLFISATRNSVQATDMYYLRPVSDLRISIPGLPHRNTRVKSDKSVGSFDATPPAYPEEQAQLEQARRRLISHIRAVGVTEYLEEHTSRGTTELITQLGEQGLGSLASTLEDTFINSMLEVTKHTGNSVSFPQGVVAVAEVLHTLARNAETLESNELQKQTMLTRLEEIREQWELAKNIQNVATVTFLQKQGISRYVGSYGEKIDVILRTLSEAKDMLELA